MVFLNIFNRCLSVFYYVLSLPQTGVAIFNTHTRTFYIYICFWGKSLTTCTSALGGCGESNAAPWARSAPVSCDGVCVPAPTRPCPYEHCNVCVKERQRRSPRQQDGNASAPLLHLHQPMQSQPNTDRKQLMDTERLSFKIRTKLNNIADFISSEEADFITKHLLLCGGRSSPQL